MPSFRTNSIPGKSRDTGKCLVVRRMIAPPRPHLGGAKSDDRYRPAFKKVVAKSAETAMSGVGAMARVSHCAQRCGRRTAGRGGADLAPVDLQEASGGETFGGADLDVDLVVGCGAAGEQRGIEAEHGGAAGVARPGAEIAHRKA